MKIEELQGEHSMLLATHTNEIGSAALQAELRVDGYGGYGLWFWVCRNGVPLYETQQLSTAVRKFNEVTA